jgi:hypothetical protein
MPKKDRADEAYDKLQWNWKSIEIFFNLIKSQAELTADDFARECRKVQMPPAQIARNSGILFKQMKAQGYIKKTKNFKLSERNGSSPLPIYLTCPNKGQK